MNSYRQDILPPVFDPNLWKLTKVSAITLIVLGAFLLIPAGYVFFLAFLLLTMGVGPSIISSGEEASMFWP